MSWTDLVTRPYPRALSLMTKKSKSCWVWLDNKIQRYSIWLDVLLEHDPILLGLV